MKWVIIRSGNGLSPMRRQAFTWNNDGLLPIRPFWTNFTETSIKTQRYSSKTFASEYMLFAKRQTHWHSLNVLTHWGRVTHICVGKLTIIGSNNGLSPGLNRFFQCMGKIFCVEFQRYPLKFQTKYLAHTLKDVDFIHRWKFKSS